MKDDVKYYICYKVNPNSDIINIACGPCEKDEAIEIMNSIDNKHAIRVCANRICPSKLKDILFTKEEFIKRCNDQSNLIELRYNVYLCKTQAGFRKLIKRKFVDAYHTNKEIFGRLSNYPEKYPAIVIPDNVGFFETGYPDVYIIYPKDFNE